MESTNSPLAGPKADVCEACGKSLECNPGGDCWCMHEKVSEQTLEALRARYERCLCLECLRKEDGTAS